MAGTPQKIRVKREASSPLKSVENISEFGSNGESISLHMSVKLRIMIIVVPMCHFH